MHIIYEHRPKQKMRIEQCCSKCKMDEDDSIWHMLT
jgi:hypothetical protein